jgi:hypothetical protein
MSLMSMCGDSEHAKRNMLLNPQPGCQPVSDCAEGTPEQPCNDSTRLRSMHMHIYLSTDANRVPTHLAWTIHWMPNACMQSCGMHPTLNMGVHYTRKEQPTICNMLHF